MKMEIVVDDGAEKTSPGTSVPEKSAPETGNEHDVEKLAPDFDEEPGGGEESCSSSREKEFRTDSVPEISFDLEDCYLCLDCGNKLLINSDKLSDHCNEFADHFDIVPICAYNKFSVKMTDLGNSKRFRDLVDDARPAKRPKLCS